MPSESSGEKDTKDTHQTTVSPGEYHDIIMNAPIGFFRSTPKGRFLVANQALATIYGFSDPEELISSMSDLGQQLYCKESEYMS